MKTILVVDDDFAIAELLEAVLVGEGYEVVTANNGQEALACLGITRPDVVLCDVMMPVLDGRELCRRMQTMPAYRAIPIVLMSAASTIFHDDDCDFAALLAKPFDLDVVLNTVTQVISKNG